MMRYLLLLLIGVPIMVFAQQSHYKIYSTIDRREITLEQLLVGLERADVVFFGEEHNDSIAHVLQLEVFKGLHRQSGDRLALSMEMFQTDVQLVLDEYLAGQITEKNLSTDTRPWKNYKDYRSLVEYARAQGIYVLAANAPSRYTNRVTRSGIASLNELSNAARALLAPLPIDTLVGRYYDKFSDLLGGHADMGHMKIYQSQNVWDATMAWNISRLVKRQKKTQILHLNGRFHSDEKLGTYAHLQRYAPGLKLLNISSFSHESFGQPDWRNWEHLGDFIIITDPKVARSF